MAAPIMRTAFRTTAALGAGALIANTAYNHYQNTTLTYTRQAHAETLPSDTQASMKKVPWKGFTELTLKSSEPVNHNVKKLTFSLPDSDSTTGLSPVTSLLTQHTPTGAWIPVFRPYTPISSASEPGTVTFLIKKYPGGKASGKMHSLTPGDTIKFKPLHEFDYKPNQHKSLLLIGGGSGITPLYQLTRAVLDNPADTTQISLVYANNTPGDILLRKEFDELANQHPDRFRRVFTVSQNGEGDSGVETGYVTKQTIAKVWQGRRQDGQKVLVSGPPAMTEAIAGAKGGFGWTQGSLGGILKEMGYGKDDVHKF